MLGLNQFPFEASNIFVAQPNNLYRVVSIKQPSKAFTATKGKHRQKLCISDYVDHPSQKFKLIPNGNKYAFVVQSSNSALYIPKDNQQNGAHIKFDEGQHESSWFSVLQVLQGEFANRGYRIITSAGKSLDLQQGNISNGSKIQQCDTHNNWNQIWLIVPADQPVPQQNQFKYNSHENHANSPSQRFNGEMQGIFKKSFTYSIICLQAQGKCLQVGKDGYVVIADYNGNVSQKYLFEYDKTEKKYSIKSAANFQYLAAGLLCGTDVVAKSQVLIPGISKWSIEPSKKSANCFKIVSFTDHSMDVPQSNYTNGTRIQKHGMNDGKNQRFLILENPEIAHKPENSIHKNPYQLLTNNTGKKSPLEFNNPKSQGFNNQGFNQGSSNHGFNQIFNNQESNLGIINKCFEQIQGSFKKNTTYALICSQHQQKCLQVRERYLVIADYQGLPSQKFTLEYNREHKKYRIKSAYNQYLNGPTFSAGVDLYFDRKNQNKQNSTYYVDEYWEIIPSKNVGRGYNFKSWSSHAIDVPGCDYTHYGLSKDLIIKEQEHIINIFFIV